MDDSETDLLEKLDCDNRLSVLKTYMLEVHAIAEQFAYDKTMDGFINMLSDQYRRLIEIQKIPFGDQPPALLAIEEQSFLNLLRMLNRQYSVCVERSNLVNRSSQSILELRFPTTYSRIYRGSI
ncbi:MAG TPA: hypothetical protein VM260_19255 [Pirellula sp.]|nr:hypothetical protein [Pirellula sp.]